MPRRRGLRGARRACSVAAAEKARRTDSVSDGRLLGNGLDSGDLFLYISEGEQRRQGLRDEEGLLAEASCRWARRGEGRPPFFGSPLDFSANGTPPAAADGDHARLAQFRRMRARARARVAGAAPSLGAACRRSCLCRRRRLFSPISCRRYASGASAAAV